MQSRQSPGAAVVAGYATFAAAAYLLLFAFGFAGLLWASIAGGAMVGALSLRKSLTTNLFFIVPTAIPFVVLPFVVAAMSDGHPGNTLWWVWAFLPHILLSLAAIDLVGRIGSDGVRIAVPIGLIVCSALASFGMSIYTKRQGENLEARTRATVGPSFERDLLPHLLTRPEKITWSEPVRNDKEYTVDGESASGRIHIRLKGSDAYNVTFELSLTAATFEMGDQKDLAGRLARAKLWLRDAGVADELTHDLNVYSRDRWDTSPHQIYLTPGQGRLTISGFLSFAPNSATFDY